jgi:hypothetical protein
VSGAPVVSPLSGRHRARLWLAQRTNLSGVAELLHFPGHRDLFSQTLDVLTPLPLSICRLLRPSVTCVAHLDLFDLAPRPRQRCDASTVVRSRSAHQSLINRCLDDRVPSRARRSLSDFIHWSSMNRFTPASDVHPAYTAQASWMEPGRVLPLDTWRAFRQLCAIVVKSA